LDEESLIYDVAGQLVSPKGNPPALPEDSQSLTVPGVVFESETNPSAGVGPQWQKGSATSCEASWCRLFWHVTDVGREYQSGVWGTNTARRAARLWAAIPPPSLRLCRRSL